MNNSGFKTVKGSTNAEIYVKKSHFIAYVSRAENEDEARNFIDEISTRHRDASHNTYAYIVGRGVVTERYSDAGEPGGTAGIPILEKIRHLGLTDTIVVVTRYFGGTKLGTGGLARAYGGCAEDALGKAGITSFVPGCLVFVTVDYHFHGKLRNFLGTKDYIIVDEKFSDHVIISTLIPKSELNKAMDFVAELTNAQARTDVVSEQYIETES